MHCGRRWKFYIITAAASILLTANTSSLALVCPEPPVQTQKDWNAEVEAAVAKIGKVSGAELSAKTKVVTNDLLGKLPDAGKIYLEQMLFAAYCSALRDDQQLADTGKARLLLQYRREIASNLSNEPKRNAATPSPPPRSKTPNVAERRSKGAVDEYSDQPRRIRIALVIGEQRYRDSAIESLQNARNDAEQVAAKLESKGFQVILKSDADRAETITAIEQFRTLLSIGGVGLIYYAGHGVRIDNSDFMIPTDLNLADVRSAQDIKRTAINVSLLLKPLDKIIRLQPESSGEVIIYSSGEGGLAIDTMNSSQHNSPFAAAFLSALDRPEAEIFEVFRDVAKNTRISTQGQQHPWLAASTDAKFFFDDVQADRGLGIFQILIFDACRDDPFGGNVAR